MSDVHIPLEHSEYSRQKHLVQKQLDKLVGMDQFNQRRRHLWADWTVGPATADSSAGLCKVSMPLLK